MANAWYVQHNGKQYGPLTPANLKKLADDGKITPATNVRIGTEGAWVPASRVQGLFASAKTSSDAAAKAPRTPAPSAPLVKATSAPPAKVRPLAPVTVAPSTLPKAVPTDSGGSMAAKLTSAVALILGILALTTSWLPALGGIIGWTGIIVGAIGVPLGIAGLVLSAMSKGSGLALGIAGTSSSLVGLVLSLVCASVFHLFSPAPQPVAVKLPPPVVAPPPVVEQPVEPEPAPPPEPVWTDASQPILLGDINARIVSAVIENVRLESADLGVLKREKPKPMLKIRVSLENVGTNRIVEAPGWIGGGALVGQGVGQLLGGELGKAAQAVTASAQLNDNFNNTYPQTPAISVFGAQSQLGKDIAIRPGGKAEHDLIYPPPLATIEYLRLELAPTGFGGEEPLRFQIPKGMIKGL